MASKVLWIEFAGLGYVAGPFTSSIIANPVTNIGGNVYEVELLWTDAYGDNTIMERNVGAQVYVEGYSNRNVPDGYYMITDATTTTVTITGEFDVAPTIGAPTTSATIRIEDYYRLCTSIPDMVTGESARSRWVPALVEGGFTATLGQKIDIRGSVASFDGFSIEYALMTPGTSSGTAQEIADKTELALALRTILRSDFPHVMDIPGNICVLSSIAHFGATAIEKKLNLQPALEFVANEVTYNYRPTIIDREAIIILNDAGGTGSGPTGTRDLDVIRGVLGTSPRYHESGAVLYDGLQTGQAATVRIKKLDKDIITYDVASDFSTIESGGLFYIGIVENVNILGGTSRVQIEISPQIFASSKNSPGDKLGDNGRLVSFVSNPVSGEPDVRWAVAMDSRYAELPWDWVKVGPIAIRVRVPTDPAVNTDKTLDSRAGIYTGVYKTISALDDIAYDPDYPDYNDNYVILEPTTSEIAFENLSRAYPKALIVSSSDVGTSLEDITTTRLAPEGAQNRESLTLQNYGSEDGLANRDGVETYNVIRINMRLLADEQPQPCHIFKNAQMAIETSEENRLTDSYRSFSTVADVLLQILTSVNGDGANGPFDVLPPGLGLGIDKDTIDWLSFGWDDDTNTQTGSPNVLSYKLELLLENVVLTQKDSMKFNKWITSKILQPVNLSLVQLSNGKISISDMTNFNEGSSGLTTVTDADLEYQFDGDKFSISQEYDAKRLFDRIIGTNTNPAIRPSLGQNTTVTTVPSIVASNSDEDFDELSIRSRLFTFIQSEPLKYEHPFVAGARPGSDGAAYSMSLFASSFSQVYGNIIPSITFVSRDSLLEPGEKFIAQLSNLINSDGSRLISGVAIVVDKKTNILAEQAKYECIILSEGFVDTVNWSASADVLAGSTLTAINISENEYTSTRNDSNWVKDLGGFTVTDYVLLYDENFTMLSVDAGGNPDPREIVTLTPGSPDVISIDSAFTDNAGVKITPAATDIIMHADYSLQLIPTQAEQSWFGRNSFR